MSKIKDAFQDPSPEPYPGEIEEVYQFMKDEEWDPESIRDPVEKAKYLAWLAKQTK